MRNSRPGKLQQCHVTATSPKIPPSLPPDGKSERSGCRAGPAARRQHEPCLWSRARPTTAAGRTQLLSPLCLEQNPSAPHARPHPSARWCRRPSRPAACPCTSSARCLPSSGSWFCRPSSARTWCTSAAPGITATGSGLQQGPGPAPTSPLAPTSSRASSGFAARSLASSALPGFDGSTAGSAPSVPRKRCGGAAASGPQTAPHGPVQPQYSPTWPHTAPAPLPAPPACGRAACRPRSAAPCSPSWPRSSPAPAAGARPGTAKTRP